ncbi:TetR/AcrR family transcriptional regulator [candidate division WOR-3 bacterium]|nr:TetR/AcrR family transcriptional regulator [candidate division WOR-3 bacterium]
MNKAKDKREKIIKKAREIFSRFGFRKTSMKDIAHSLRMGKASLYYYFKSKQDIFKGVVESESQVYFDSLKKELNRRDDPVEKLRYFAQIKMKKLKERANYYATMRDEYLKGYNFIEEIRERELQKEKSLIESILEEGVKIGKFLIEDISTTAEAIVTALTGLELKWTRGKSINAVKKDAENLISILYKGVQK